MVRAGWFYEGFWRGVFECFEVWCGKSWVGGWGFVGPWCLVFCGGNWGGEVLCNVGWGTLVEISQGLKVGLFSHCSRRVWELGDKGMSSQDCHS